MNKIENDIQVLAKRFYNQNKNVVENDLQKLGCSKISQIKIKSEPL